MDHSAETFMDHSDESDATDRYLALNPTASVSLNYPPLSFNNGSWIQRDLLSNPPMFVVCSRLPSGSLVRSFNRAYSLVLFDADNGYLHWLVVNHSTSHMTAIIDYLPPDTQLPGRDGLIRRLGVAVLEQARVFSAADIHGITISVRLVRPFDFCLVSFAKSLSLMLVDHVVMYYSALAIYEGDHGVRYLAAAEGVVTALQPYAPAIQHLYLPSVRWGRYSLAETVYRIARIGQAYAVTPGGRFRITYPSSRDRQPDEFPFPVLHVRYEDHTVA